MGEIADMMLDGTMEPETGEPRPGFPVTKRVALQLSKPPKSAKARRNRTRQKKAHRAKMRRAQP